MDSLLARFIISFKVKKCDLFRNFVICKKDDLEKIRFSKFIQRPCIINKHDETSFKNKLIKITRFIVF